METSQGIKSIKIERKIIRADGVPRPGDENQVCAYWDADPEVMQRVLAPGGGVIVDGDGITPKAPQMGAVHPSEKLLGMTRDELLDK